MFFFSFTDSNTNTDTNTFSNTNGRIAIGITCVYISFRIPKRVLPDTNGTNGKKKKGEIRSYRIEERGGGHYQWYRVLPVVLSPGGEARESALVFVFASLPDLPARLDPPQKTERAFHANGSGPPGSERPFARLGTARTRLPLRARPHHPLLLSSLFFTFSLFPRGGRSMRV